MTRPSPRNQELLNDALDGQLSAAEMAQFEQRLESDPDLAREWVRLRNLRSVLQQVGTESAPTDLADRILAEVRQSLAPGASSEQAPPPSLGGETTKVELSLWERLGGLRVAAMIVMLLTVGGIVFHERPWENPGPMPKDSSDRPHERAKVAENAEGLQGLGKDVQGRGSPELAPRPSPRPVPPPSAAAPVPAIKPISQGSATGASDLDHDKYLPPAPGQSMSLQAEERKVQDLGRALSLHVLSLEAEEADRAPSDLPKSERSAWGVVTTMGRNLEALKEAEVTSPAFASFARDGDQFLADVQSFRKAQKRSANKGGAPAEGPVEEAHEETRARRATGGEDLNGQYAFLPPKRFFLVSGKDAVSRIRKTVGQEGKSIADVMTAPSKEPNAEAASAADRMTQGRKAPTGYAYFVLSLTRSAADELIGKLESSSDLSLRALESSKMATRAAGRHVPTDPENKADQPATAAYKAVPKTEVVLVVLDR